MSWTPLSNSEALRAKLISSGVLGADAYVVVAGPANVYAHYVTTREEYGIQRYEGASTIFGPCEFTFTLLSLMITIISLQMLNPPMGYYLTGRVSPIRFKVHAKFNLCAWPDGSVERDFFLTYVFTFCLFAALTATFSCVELFTDRHADFYHSMQLPWRLTSTSTRVSYPSLRIMQVVLRPQIHLPLNKPPKPSHSR